MLERRAWEVSRSYCEFTFESHAFWLVDLLSLQEAVIADWFFRRRRDKKVLKGKRISDPCEALVFTFPRQIQPYDQAMHDAAGMRSITI